MKTVRFSEVVARSGRPEIHLAWTPPASDRVLQTALKQSRVLTVHQQVRGAKKDFGVVGLETGRDTQRLVFPKSLRAFADRRVIGINYELLADALSLGTQPKAAHAAGRPTRPPTRKGKTKPPEPRLLAPLPEEEPPAALPFTPEDTDDDPVKAEIRTALRDLSAGRTKEARRRLTALLA